MQILPPIVAAFQILNDARNALQHSCTSDIAGQSPVLAKRYNSAMRQVAARLIPAGDGSIAGQWSWSRSISVSVAICGSENSHVPPPSQAYPLRHWVISSAAAGRFISLIVLISMTISG